MPGHQPLSTLHIVGIRYHQTRPATMNEGALRAYQASGVYQTAGVPVTITHPQMPESERVDEEPVNLGLLGGQVADIVAGARRRGEAIMMTGGDCNHITGVFGGLQDVHGPDVRVGLVWFDAHGDFNTPRTTLSGMLGGMPVAVCAGLAFPQWREGSHIAAPVPTDRIVMVDVRNLDSAEAALIKATDVTIAAAAPGFPGADLQQAIDDLAQRCDLIYLHIDSDILDERYVPNHNTKEPNGPDMDQVRQAIDMVMATGKVGVAAVVSISAEGEGADIALQSGTELIRSCLHSWRQHGMSWFN